jgi:transmembrane sensor
MPTRPPASDAIRQASSWFAKLHAGEAGAEDRRAWEHWLGAHPSHRQAWRLVKEVRSQLGQLPAPRAAGHALDAAGRARRRALGRLAVLLGVASAGAWSYRALGWRGWLAGYRTATGERRQLALPDGSQMWLNTASALDVAFSPHQRLLKLHAGEVLLSTAPDPAHRPFLVRTPHGEALALGTRFTVRVGEQGSEVAVLEKAVRVQPASGEGSVTVPAGWQVHFDADRLGALLPNDPSTASWQGGSIVAVDMPLRRLVAELARYREGHLSCADEVAALKVSGAYPIDDTDRALAALARGFPLRIVRHTRYWLSVEAR